MVAQYCVIGEHPGFMLALPLGCESPIEQITSLLSVGVLGLLCVLTALASLQAHLRWSFAYGGLISALYCPALEDRSASEASQSATAECIPQADAATLEPAHLSLWQPSKLSMKVLLNLRGCTLGYLPVMHLMGTGWDACAHMSEETVGAQKSVPYAIILSVVASAVLGYIFMIALLISVQVTPLTSSAGLCWWGVEVRLPEVKKCVTIWLRAPKKQIFSACWGLIDGRGQRSIICSMAATECIWHLAMQEASGPSCLHDVVPDTISGPLTRHH